MSVITGVMQLSMPEASACLRAVRVDMHVGHVSCSDFNFNGFWQPGGLMMRKEGACIPWHNAPKFFFFHAVLLRMVVCKNQPLVQRRFVA